MKENNKNNSSSKIIFNIGRIIAVGGALLSIAHIIPSDGYLVWTLVIIGALMMLIGKQTNEK